MTAPDHNPEQVVERLRALALKIASDIEPDWPHAEELHRDVQAVRQAADLLDYYASVVEALTSEGAVEAAARVFWKGFDTKAADGLRDAMRQQHRECVEAALQHAQADTRHD